MVLSILKLEKGDELTGFTIDRLEFIRINRDYLKVLYDAHNEVYFKDHESYNNKLYLGVLVNTNDKKYVIPFTSAKPKHRKWKNITNTNYLIYENVLRSRITSKDIFKEIENPTYVKKIISVLEIKKMIPVREGVYEVIYFNKMDTAIEGNRKYKDLLLKEYRFCLNIISDVLIKATSLYNEQVQTGIVLPFFCDFRKLESVCDNYIITIQEAAATKENV